MCILHYLSVITSVVITIRNDAFPQRVNCSGVSVDKTKGKIVIFDGVDI